MKKVLSILLVLAITLVVSVPVFAGQNSINGIRSLKTQAELVEYATNIFPKHLHALVESGDLNGPIEEYSFGEPFTVFNVKENTNSSCFRWAATCAAMINHLKGRSLSASDVANYVFPNNPEQGATWSGIKKAYNHWGLYPSQTGTISFTEVKSDINSNKPMHLGLNGHSVGLIGYEDWVGSAGGNNDRILILLEPNGGVHKSVALNSSGNFTYSLGGGRNAWKYTRRF